MDVELPCAAYRGRDPFAFVSYAHADAHLVFDVIRRLNDAGYRVWFDEGIEPAEDWPNRIATRIDDCAVLVVFVSPVSVARAGVVNEVRYAHTHDKPILAVHLAPTDLPNGLNLLLGSPQALPTHRGDWAGAITAMAATLRRHGIVPDVDPVALEPTRPTSARAPAAIGPASGMPRRARPRPAPTAVSSFADRIPESEALLASVEFQRERLHGDAAIDPDVFPHVLVYYGGGGVGKTGLSRQLQAWVSREELRESDWAPWPHPGVVPVRWDFHEADGNLDLVRLLVALRTALLTTGRPWVVFDAALAAYLEGVRIGDGDGLGRGVTGAVEDAVLRSLQQVAAEMSCGVPSELTPVAVRRLSRLIAEDPPARFRRYEGVVELLAACAGLSSRAHASDIVADLFYVLTQEIYFIAPPDRPALVIFVDHFEKLQRRAGGASEGTIASLVASLPYALFVITGRDRLSWTESHRTDLPYAGEPAWPGLASAATADPRQHLLGRLSDFDTRRLYEANRVAYGWDLADDLIDDLVERSAGLPLHVEAVLQLARNLHRAAPTRPLQRDDLLGELPAVVHRLLQVLEDDEADAFRAACVLPSFDVSLAAAVGRVAHGAVERAIRLALVEADEPAGTYPYRVHDEIRRLVQADRSTPGYWADGDWRAAATRGLQEAIRRIREGHATSSDAVQVEATVLAIRVAHEAKIYEPGLAQLLNDGPTIGGLAPLVPAPAARAESDADDLIAFVHAIALPFPAGAAALAAIDAENPEIAHFVDRWRAYRLRNIGRRSEALGIFASMLERDPDHTPLCHFQYALTLRSLRRFRDAIEYVTDHRPDQLTVFVRAIERFHGVYPADLSIEVDRARKNRSRRLRLELEVNVLLARARGGGVERHEVEEHLQRAVDNNQRADQARCLMILGYADLLERTRFEAVVSRLGQLQQSYGSTVPMVPHLLALRALVTRTEQDVRRAFGAASVLRDQSGPELAPDWVSTECWLEELGCPVPSVPTQWLVPQAEVRANWLAVADRIVARASAADGAS